MKKKSKDFFFGNYFIQKTDKKKFLRGLGWGGGL